MGAGACGYRREFRSPALHPGRVSRRLGAAVPWLSRYPFLLSDPFVAAQHVYNLKDENWKKKGEEKYIPKARTNDHLAHFFSLLIVVVPQRSLVLPRRSSVGD
jgi:hypothetical protein